MMDSSRTARPAGGCGGAAAPPHTLNRVPDRLSELVGLT